MKLFTCSRKLGTEIGERKHSLDQTKVSHSTF